MQVRLSSRTCTKDLLHNGPPAFRGILFQSKGRSITTGSILVVLKCTECGVYKGTSNWLIGVCHATNVNTSMVLQWVICGQCQLPNDVTVEWAH